jgi:hypothetical protein
MLACPQLVFELLPRQANEQRALLLNSAAAKGKESREGVRQLLPETPGEQAPKKKYCYVGNARLSSKNIYNSIQPILY